jgi:hypothetical protein
MIGKVVAAILLLALLGTSIAMSVMVLGFGQSMNSTIILMSALSSGGLVFLLNLVGLGIRPKYFGAMGVVIAGVIFGYGIYVLATEKTLIGPVDPKVIPLVGGVSTGVGAVGLLTSAGIFAR